MKKEEVIIFEGEHNFVLPKNRVRNKKTGVSYYVPDDVNVVGIDKSGISPIEEPPVQPDAPREPDEPIRIITNPPSGSSDISVRTYGGGGGGGTIITQPTIQPSTNMGTTPPRIGEPIIGLGNPTKQFPTAGEEIVDPKPTPTPSPTPTPTLTIPTLPIDTIPPSSKFGGGGGGGGSKDGASASKKTFLQKYWWLLLLVAGGGYYIYKKNKK